MAKLPPALSPQVTRPVTSRPSASGLAAAQRAAAIAVLDPGRPGMLGREPIVDREHRHVELRAPSRRRTARACRGRRTRSRRRGRTGRAAPASRVFARVVEPQRDVAARAGAGEVADHRQLARPARRRRGARRASSRAPRPARPHRLFGPGRRSDNRGTAARPAAHKGRSSASPLRRRIASRPCVP